MAIEGAAPLAHWRITHHARERLADRGVSPSELIDALLHPRQTNRLETGHVTWGRHIGVYWNSQVEDGQRVKVIISVLLNGSGKEQWDVDAVRFAPHRDTVLNVEELLGHFAPTPTTEPAVERSVPRRSHRGGTITHTNVYDGIPASMLQTARDLLQQAGLDPTDLSPVRRVGNRLEIRIK